MAEDRKSESETTVPLRMKSVIADPTSLLVNARLHKLEK
jgi:hypothetical protein